MPKKYEAIRDSLIENGTPLKEARKIAAATFIKNSKDKDAALRQLKKRPKNKKG